MEVRYTVRMTSAAKRQLAKLNPPARARTVAAMEILAQTPRPPKSIKMAGIANRWRVRTGDYRIIYEIHDDELMVLVIKVGHRRSVYRGYHSKTLVNGNQRRAAVYR